MFLRSDRAGPTVAWVDLGSDVLAIVGGASSPSVATIRRLAGKPVRAVFAPNGTGRVLGSVVELVPASRGPANGGLEFRGTMTLGTRRVEIRELERAVSAGNGIVYLPEARVLFALDLVGDGAVLDSARTEVWIRVLGRLRLLGPKVVVPGRGPVGGPELLERTRSALVAARAAVRRGVDQRRTIDQIASTAPNPALARQIFREMVGLVPPPDDRGTRTPAAAGTALRVGLVLAGDDQVIGTGNLLHFDWTRRRAEVGNAFNAAVPGSFDQSTMEARPDVLVYTSPRWPRRWT